jgi:hypothetical protein
MTAHFRIVGSNLSGVSCGPAPTELGEYQSIHVGVQRGDEAVDLVRGDQSQAVFELDVEIKARRFIGP